MRPLQCRNSLTRENCLIRRVLLRGLLLVVATTFSLVSLELGITAWYGDVGTRGPYRLSEGWDSPFLFRGASDRLEIEYGVIDRSNDAGAPAEALSASDPGGRYRILSYGDSIAGGYGIEPTEMYARLLSDRLSEAGGRGIELITMHRGHSPTLYSFHMRRDVPLVRPDAVIVQIELANDISDEAMVRTVGRDSEGLPLELRSNRYILGLGGHILAPLSFSGSFIERTKLYAKLSRWFGRVLQRVSPNPIFEDDSQVYFYSHSSERWFLTEGVLEEGFERLFGALDTTHKYLQARDIEFVLLITPSRHLYTDDQYSSAAIGWMQRAEARARTLGMPLLSPRKNIATAGGAELLMDFCHPTAEGNRVIADALEPLLLELLKVHPIEQSKGKRPDGSRAPARGALPVT